MIGGLLRWFLEWMAETHRRHQFYPSRFHLRGIVIALLIAVPGFLWLKQIFTSPLKVKFEVYRKPCPGREPVAFRELAKNPFLFSDRLIWLRGKVELGRRLCAGTVPDSGDFCPPCRSTPVLRIRNISIPLSGLFLDPRDGVERPLSCERGSDCKWNCFPLKLNLHYNLGGFLKVDIISSESSPRPKFRIRRFQVRYFCPLQARGSR